MKYEEFVLTCDDARIYAKKKEEAVSRILAVVVANSKAVGVEIPDEKYFIYFETNTVLGKVRIVWSKPGTEDTVCHEYDIEELVNGAAKARIYNEY